MADFQSQQQQSGNAYTADQEAIQTALKDVHTFLPGIIHSFDPDTQTAQVQPAIKRIFTAQGAVNLPMCLDVPVYFLKCGPFTVTAPVATGDECLLGFFERAIDRWFFNGGTQEPSEYRMHDLSDGFAIVGISSLPHKIAGFNPTDYEIRLLDGSAKIKMKPDGTIMQQNGGGSTTLTPDGKFIIDADVVVKRTTTLEGALTSTSNAAATFAADLKAAGKSVSTHTHADPQGGNVGGPI